MTFKPVPADLYRFVEPEAGQVLPATRWRQREEFVPDWEYIYSPRASAVAVAAALFCSPYATEENWSRALRAHAPGAIALLDAAGVTLRHYAQGRCPAQLGGEVDFAINEALGGYRVVALFPGCGSVDLMGELEPTEATYS
jgi:hypothetical protein